MEKPVKEMEQQPEKSKGREEIIVSQMPTEENTYF